MPVSEGGFGRALRFSIGNDSLGLRAAAQDFDATSGKVPQRRTLAFPAERAAATTPAVPATRAPVEQAPPRADRPAATDDPSATTSSTDAPTTAPTPTTGPVAAATPFPVRGEPARRIPDGEGAGAPLT